MFCTHHVLVMSCVALPASSCTFHFILCHCWQTRSFLFGLLMDRWPKHRSFPSFLRVLCLATDSQRLPVLSRQHLDCECLVQLDIGIFCGPVHTAYLTLVQAAGVAFIGVTDCFLSYRSTHSKKARTLLIIGRKNIYARFSITTVDAEPSTQLDRYSASLLNIKIHSLAFH